MIPQAGIQRWYLVHKWTRRIGSEPYTHKNHRLAFQFESSPLFFPSRHKKSACSNPVAAAYACLDGESRVQNLGVMLAVIPYRPALLSPALPASRGESGRRKSRIVASCARADRNDLRCAAVSPTTWGWVRPHRSSLIVSSPGTLWGESTGAAEHQARPRNPEVAADLAHRHLEQAFTHGDGGNVEYFAMALKKVGYVRLADFRRNSDDGSQDRL